MWSIRLKDNESQQYTISKASLKSTNLDFSLSIHSYPHERECKARRPFFLIFYRIEPAVYRLFVACTLKCSARRMNRLHTERHANWRPS